MHFAAILLGLLLLAIVLWDLFETVVLPRTVTRRLRLARVFYRSTWVVWSAFARVVLRGDAREAFLSLFGPLSLLMLLGVWAAGVIVGFGLLQWGLHTELAAPEAARSLGTYIYLSGSTLFTLGYGDVSPVSRAGRAISVVEAGVGLGVLAMVISYLPVLYDSFSRRETGIAMLDARAGSPPSAGELLLRHARGGGMPELARLLKEWEQWSAELLESHLSYPVLTYYRSQHDRQSWLSAITAILDTCACLAVALDESAEWGPGLRWQANLTYAMARHAIVDLALILYAPPATDGPERLDPDAWRTVCHELKERGVLVHTDEVCLTKLTTVRAKYEPYLVALSRKLGLALPLWAIDDQAADNWQISAWEAEGHFSGRARRRRK